MGLFILRFLKCWLDVYFFKQMKTCFSENSHRKFWLYHKIVYNFSCQSCLPSPSHLLAYLMYFLTVIGPGIDEIMHNGCLSSNNCSWQLDNHYNWSNNRNTWDCKFNLSTVSNRKLCQKFQNNCSMVCIKSAASDNPSNVDEKWKTSFSFL